MRVDTVPDPTIEQPTDAIIRVTSTGLCGSDLHVYELGVASTQHLPPCPSCSNGEWSTVTGGDAADDPYPDRA